jgi:hypothetical protein
MLDFEDEAPGNPWLVLETDGEERIPLTNDPALIAPVLQDLERRQKASAPTRTKRRGL